MHDQSYIKRHNIQLVMDLLKEHQPVSRTELVRLTDMSPTSITRIASLLIGCGLVEECERASSSARGRKAINLCERPAGCVTAGFFADQGQLRVCFMDFSGRVLFSDSSLAAKRDRTPRETAQEAKRLYDRALDRSDRHDLGRVRAVGVAVAGIVDHLSGRMLRSDQMHWLNEDLGGAFREAFQMPAWVENDVKACLIGEKSRMGIPEREDTAYLLIGSGIGLAITGNGALLRGRRNEAGEIEKIVLNPGSQLEPDYLQTHLITRCLIDRAQRVDPSICSVDAIALAYRQGIEWAQVLLNDFKRHLKLVLSMLRGIISPERIILGGSTIERVAWLLEDVLAEDAVLIGEAYEDACTVGAAIVAMRHAVQEMVGDQAQIEQRDNAAGAAKTIINAKEI